MMIDQCVIFQSDGFPSHHALGLQHREYQSTRVGNTHHVVLLRLISHENDLLRAEFAGVHLPSLEQLDHEAAVGVDEDWLRTQHARGLGWKLVDAQWEEVMNQVDDVVRKADNAFMSTEVLRQGECFWHKL